MKKIQTLLVFSLALFVASPSYAYFGAKFGAINVNGDTAWGGGLLFGLPLPIIKGLAAEIEQSAYFDDNSAVDLWFLQTSLGPVLDFNKYLTPDSNFFHPYIRGGFAYGYIASDNNALVDDQDGVGFYSGIGFKLMFPLIMLGFETDYNYLDFDPSVDNDYWSYFLMAGIHF